MKEKLFFGDSTTKKLCGILSDPTSNFTKPIIILAHGLASNKDRKSYLKLEEKLNRKKISTFRFDFFGHGESGGKFEDLTISKAVNDIIVAIVFLKRKGYQKVGLLGSSFGGMASILAAAKSKDLIVLALKCPVSDYLGKIIASISHSSPKEWKEKGFISYITRTGEKLKLNYSFFEDAEKVKGYEEAAKITIPTLIVHGDKDKNVPIQQSRKLAKVIRDSKLEIITGADHFFSKPEEFEEAYHLLVDFIEYHSK